MFKISNSANSQKVIMVSADKIKPNPNQPRKKFDSEALYNLSQSISQYGIIQPLTVKKLIGKDYELIAGERRLRAAILAGLKEIPCIEMQLDASQSSVIALIENIQRQDLNFFEEADGIEQLIKHYSMTQEEVAHKLGRSQSAIANKLRLLKLTYDERRKIIDAQLSERHARALLRVDAAKRKMLLNLIISKKLNVNETDKVVEALLNPEPQKKQSERLYVVKDIRIFINTITNAVNIMNKAGIEAVTVKQDYEDYLEYTVRIPKCVKHKQAV